MTVFATSTPPARLVLLLLALLSQACAGLHLYDAEREKVAQAAKKSFESADVEGTVAAARQNMTALSDAEAAQARRLVASRRDLLLLAVAGDAPCDPATRRAARPRFYDTYLACIDRELNRLVGQTPAQTPGQLRDTLERALAEMQSNRDALADDRTKFLLLFNGVVPPPCNPGKPPNPDPPVEVMDAVGKAAPGAFGQLPTIYGAFVRDCNGYRRALAAVQNTGRSGSEFRRAVDDWVASQTSLSDARSAAARLKHEHDDAIAKYNQAAAELSQDPSQEARERAKAALDKAQAAAKALERLPSMLGVKALSEDRLTRLDTVIAALKGDALDPEKYGQDLRQALGAVATIPTFADRALDIVRRAQAPPLGSLILTKELQQVRLAAAERQVARAEQRVALLEQRVAGYVDASRSMLEARYRLELAGRDARDALQDSAVTTFSLRVSAEVRAQVFRSTTAFADASSIGGAASAEAEYRLVALEYDTALDRSEDAVKEWERLISVPVDRLIAFYGSGMKAETLAAIVTQAIGLALIGVGVNR